MRVHFWHRHVRDTVLILEEGNLPYPRFPMCIIMVPWWSLNGLHKCTAQCKKGVERKQQRLATEEERAATSREFGAYGRTLEMVPSFKYLGRVISAVDDDWLVVIRNLKKSRSVL